MNWFYRSLLNHVWIWAQATKQKTHWPHVSHFTVLRPEVEAEVNVADRCRRFCRQLTQIRWTIYWGRTKQSHQVQSISCWKAVSVIATERSVPRFAYKPVSVLPFYIWVQTPSVIVSINFSKMELKIKDNKFVSVNSGKGKKKQTTFCGHHRLVLQNPVTTGITSDSMTDCYQQTLSRLLPSGFWRNVTGGYPVCQR